MSREATQSYNETPQLQSLVELHNASIWNAEKGLILIPVNCVGVMGAGLARQCKEKYPEVFTFYKDLCDKGEFNIRTMRIVEVSDTIGILLIPTKMHWKQNSRPHWVEDNLQRLGSCLDRCKYDELHVPAVGCGLGRYSVENGWGATELDIQVCLDWTNSYLIHPKVATYFYHPFNRKRG